MVEGMIMGFVTGVTATKPVYFSAQTKSISKVEKQPGWFTEWVHDRDKVCKDGLDDGKISFREASQSFGKGLIGLVKTAIKKPFQTILAIEASIALGVLTAGAALPILIAIGVGFGGLQMGLGAYKALKAKTDGEAKQAFETVGNGVFATATSALSAKGALGAASKAGVTGAKDTQGLNFIHSVAKCYEVTPEALQVSKANIETNLASLFARGQVGVATLGAVQKGAKELENPTSYMSKPNEAQAYRFNPAGSETEVLKNNPGVFRNAEGRYCIPNKWNPEAPHIIDASKEQMIMMYGPDDMAVCDGGIFKGSYVDSNAFKSNALNYQDPAKLNYGQIINVTKQAPGAYKVVPVGTEVMTLEGPQVVQTGQVVAIDHAGNPYITPAASIIKRNILSQEAIDELTAIANSVAK